MTTELRKTGISVVGDMPWGTHFCFFYETKQDLLDILVPYFNAGLENNEFCLWIISNSELLTTQEATSALRKALPDLDRYLAEGRIEVVAHDEWFLNGGAFDFRRVANRFKEKLDEALARGYAGMRVNGSPAWIQKNDGKELREFEEVVDKLFSPERIIASCTYPIGESGADFLLDVARNHHFAIARRHGNWDVLETPELMQAKREIKRLNEELEQRVIERTGELAAANEELRREIGERKRVEEQLKQNESQLAEAQHLAHVGSWSLDLRSNTVTWSDEFYRIFEVQPSEFDHSYEAVIGTTHPEDRDWLRSVLENSLKTHEPFSAYYRITLPTGELRVLHAQGAVVTDEHGNASRMHGAAQDVTERMQAEEALKESQRRLEEAQRIAHVGHWERDLRTGVITWSDEIYRILGLERQVSPPTVWEHMIHPEDRERISLVIEEAQHGIERYDVEYRIVRPDGEVRFLHSQGDIIRDEHGEPCRAFGIAQDITERKLAEALLHARGQEFRAFVENTPDQVIKYDREFQRAYANPAVAKAYDLPVEALIGKPFGSVISDAGLDVKADQLAQIRQQIAAVFDTGESSVYEITWPLPTGRKYYSIRYFPEFDLNGVVSYVWGISRDITELKETQHQILALTENSPDLIARFDRDGHYLYLNSAIEKILGIPAHELRGKRIGETLSDLIYPAVSNDILLLRGTLDKVFASGLAIETEIQVPLPTGERIFNVRLIPERDEAGRVSSVLHIGRDITDRKRAEEALRQAEEKYHGIFEHAIEGIFQTTPDGQYITVNPALARMLGYDSPQELMSSRTDIEWQQYVEPERRSDFKRLLEEHSVAQGFEYQAYRKDGSKIWLSDNGRAVRDESGAVLYYEGFTEDITERKLAEEALKKEKEILKKIFDNVPVLIGFVGEDGRVKLVNPEWERAMGWTLKELQEQDVDIFAEAYPDLSYRQEVLDFVAASTGEWVDLKIKVRDGRVIDAACAVVHLSDGTRFAIAQDITERKRAEEMLQKVSQRLIEAQEAERRRVARELHDEIGQALTAIKINLQAVQHSAGASSLAQQLNESAGIVDRALQQVRDLSFNLRPSLLDDLGLIAALRWYVDHEARRAGLTPEFISDLSDTRLPQELETACFRITQEALTNVVRHAQARRIWVELRQRGAELHLTVRDDGIGFDVEAMRRRRVSDAGLGLQGMQERALIINGKIEIKSAPTHGTEIHVWFSLTEIPSSAKKKEGSAP